MHHHVAHAERAGAEARDVAAGLERVGGGLRAVEDLEPIAGRIVEHDQVGDVPLVGQRARAARHLGAGRLEPRRKRVERGGVRDLPAEEADALAAVGIDHEALLAVVHAERHGWSGSCRVAPGRGSSWRSCPVTQVLGADADVTQADDAGFLRAHAVPCCGDPLAAPNVTGSPVGRQHGVRHI